MERYSQKWFIVVCVLLGLRIASIWTSLLSSTVSGGLFITEIVGFIGFMSITYTHLRRNCVYDWGDIFRYLLRYCSLYILLGALVQIASLLLVETQGKAMPLVGIIFLSIFPFIILLIMHSFLLFFLLKFKKR